MAESISERLLFEIEQVAELYHRLVLLVGPIRSGKTTALREIARRTGAPLVNLNLQISERLLDLTERQRALDLPKVLDEIFVANQSLILLDNVEILFDVSLKQDPLRLLQRLSRNRTVVAAWNGTVDGRYLLYATPEHPEYRRYSARELVLVCLEAAA